MHMRGRKAQVTSVGVRLRAGGPESAPQRPRYSGVWSTSPFSTGFSPPAAPSAVCRFPAAAAESVSHADPLSPVFPRSAVASAEAVSPDQRRMRGKDTATVYAAAAERPDPERPDPGRLGPRLSAAVPSSTARRSPFCWPASRRTGTGGSAGGWPGRSARCVGVTGPRS